MTDLTKILKAGQTVWTIQLGECTVRNIGTLHEEEILQIYPISLVDKEGNEEFYDIDGKYDKVDYYSSIFLTDPELHTENKLKK
jgi:hypothetical protein